MHGETLKFGYFAFIQMHSFSFFSWYQPLLVSEFCKTVYSFEDSQQSCRQFDTVLTVRWVDLDTTLAPNTATISLWL